jgi:hypothetical protein
MNLKKFSLITFVCLFNNMSSFNPYDIVASRHKIIYQNEQQKDNEKSKNDKQQKEKPSKALNRFCKKTFV